MKEKKTYNIKIILMVAILFLIPFIGQFFKQLEIDFLLELSRPVRDIIGIGLNLVILLPILYASSKKAFSKFIKRERETNTKNTMIFLFSGLVIVSTIAYFLDISVYLYPTFIGIDIIFYLLSLLLLDRKYEKESLKTNVSINDTKVAQFMNALGGKENVIDVSYEVRRLKVELKDVNEIDAEAIKEFGATGMFISGNKLQAIIGENAEELDQSLKNYLSK